MAKRPDPSSPTPLGLPLWCDSHRVHVISRADHETCRVFSPCAGECGDVAHILSDTRAKDALLYSCPKCGSTEISRDSYNNGVFVIYGPYGCAACRWSEWEKYDLSNGKSDVDEAGGRIDQWGGYIPPQAPQAPNEGAKMSRQPTEEAARQAAFTQARTRSSTRWHWNNAAAWLDATQTSCEELSSEGPVEIIIVDVLED